jgi:UDP-N-acetylmuramate--alanine ligase
VSGLKTRGHRHALALDNPDDLAGVVATEAKSGDMVVCLGAGTITYWANALPGQLAAIQQGKAEAR